MPFVVLFGHYLWWHYVLSWSDILINGLNLLRFLYHFFSIPVLVKTFFSPWRRLGESYPRNFDPSGFASTLAVNLLMRLVGLLIRLIVLVAGITAIFAAIVLGLLFLFLWPLLPVVVFLLIRVGLEMLLV